MTDTPTDKKLSERFAEAIDGARRYASSADFETLGALCLRNADDILSLFRLSESRPSAIREAVAAWMIAHGYATGHGDTLDDLLTELAGNRREAVEGERERCVAEIMRMHRYVSAPSPFNSDILAIESKREAYGLAAEQVAVLAFPWESERDQITRAAAIREAVEGERSQAASDVIAERQRQVSAEGWTAEHDDLHSTGELAQAAAVYALHSCRPPTFVFDAELQEEIPTNWPWARRWFKPRGPRRDLVRAAALIIAEIERRDRAAAIRARGEENGK